MKSPYEEKRKFPRIALKSPLRYQVRGYSDFDSAICDNISEGGAGFISNRYLAPATLVMLEINVLSRILRPVGKIVSSINLPHSDRNRLGIKFLELDNNEKHYLHDFISMQLAR